MWPVPSPSSPYLVATVDSSEFSDPDSFSKDGRHINVGDCALFKLTDGSPPFVGIIRRLVVDKEENIILCVNWFYRPADIKLGEGALLGAAPNEVFYSFHEDEIPSASLLHPCKVAFLRKGVELPSGTSSFVCRRGYDIENKCLWWLTDQNYIKSCLTQQRKEIDQLLEKTQAEMHGAAQTGGRSPKPNGTTQLKPSSDNVQNNSSISSLVKSRKREHSIHGPDSVKRECLSKGDEVDAGQLKPEHVLKSEIAKFTDKGGLVDLEGVEKLIQLMQPESAEKKVDLASRVMLVDVISVTDKFDCLGQFVHLRGLVILDEWLQEVHKGKIGDGSPKGTDKSVEEFLFALLRALDRLPVNLNALQTCNVGKSVNHLRSHKNSEIQKKARSLVDTWKKRVEAEMNIIETRSGARRGGSWPNRSMSEVSHMGGRRVSGSSDADAKISVSQPSALKSQQGKPNSVDTIAKSPESPRSTKLTTLSAAGTGSSDMPLMTIKEDKSNSSSPSANNSQSCSSDHAKTGPSCREDAPSSTSGSVGISKISSGISHGRKSSNVVQGPAVSSGQKEGVLGKFGLVNRNFASGKGSPIRATAERVADVASVDNMHNQRLIVRLPNTGRGTAQPASGGSFEDASTTFGKSPPVQPEKPDHHDRRGRGIVDGTQGNNVVAMDTDLSQGTEGMIGSDDVKMGTPGVPCDAHSRDGEIVEKLTELSKVNGSTSDVSFKHGRSYENSYSLVNALIESCAKFSAADVSAPAGDDVGMNLLASVAAGEISRSEASPIGSTENKSPLPEDTCSGNDPKLRQSVEDGCQSEENVKPVSESKKPVLLPGSYIDGKGTSFGNENTGDCNAQMDSCIVGLPQNGQTAPMAPDGKSVALAGDASASVGATNNGKEGNEGLVQSPHDRKKVSPNWPRSCPYPNLKPDSRSPSEENKSAGFASEKPMENNVVLPDAVAASVKVETQINDDSGSWSSSEKHENEKKLVHKQSSDSNIVLKKDAGKDSELRSSVGLGAKAEEADDKETGNRSGHSEKPSMDSDSSVLLPCSEHAKENVENSVVPGSGLSDPSDKFPVDVREEKPCVNELAEGGSSEAPSSRANVSSISAPVSEMTVKLDFDLNEVLPSDDGIHGEMERSSVAGRFSSVHTTYPLPSANSSLMSNRPASITVAAAAKGPFFPSENLLRGKAELGWKGSAATSAFRPAEPRKVIDVPISTSDAPVPGDHSSKHVRPFLDFDLNVGVIEDVSQNNAQTKYIDGGNRASPSGGGLGLDLNACEENPDGGLLSVSFGRPTISQLHPQSLVSGGRFSNSEPNPSMGFDLNSGPGVEEIGGEATHSGNGMQFLSTVPSVRMNNMEMGNFSSWFPPSTTYSGMAIPPVLPGRGEQVYPMVPGAAASQRMLTPATAGTSFNPEIFRGPVLSSSPAVAFPSTMPFQFPGFLFETNFSVTSNTFPSASTAYVGSSGAPLCFPTIPVGPSGVVSSPYRPFMMSLPGGSNNVPDGRRWAGQGLDLNAGPGGSDLERREETLPTALRQLPPAGSQAMADEQLKVFQQMTAGGGGLLKRKEPDDGWDADRIGYKHPSWH